MQTEAGAVGVPKYPKVGLRNPREDIEMEPEGEPRESSSLIAANKEIAKDELLLENLDPCWTSASNYVPSVAVGCTFLLHVNCLVCNIVSHLYIYIYLSHPCIHSYFGIYHVYPCT